MKKINLAVAAGVLLVSAASAAASAGVFHFSYVLDFDAPLLNECTGEVVDFSGAMKFNDLAVVDGRGGAHFSSEVVYQGITGVGLDTGTEFQLVGHSSAIANGDFVDWTEYSVNNEFWMIGHGTGENLAASYQTHVTFTPDGETTAQIENFRVGCY
jgi:hypothetical protein